MHLQHLILLVFGHAPCFASLKFILHNFCLLKLAFVVKCLAERAIYCEIWYFGLSLAKFSFIYWQHIGDPHTNVDLFVLLEDVIKGQ
jgi:hypothetical protein